MPDPQDWPHLHWLETHEKITTAAARARRGGRPLLVKTVAEDAGVSPRTVKRHFPRLADALDLTLPFGATASFVAVIRKRPPKTMSLRDLVPVMAESMDAMNGEQTRRLAVAVAASPDNWLVAQAAFITEWEPPLLEALTRESVELSSVVRAAVTLLGTLTLIVLRDWAAGGFATPLAEFWTSAMTVLGV